MGDELHQQRLKRWPQYGGRDAACGRVAASDKLVCVMRLENKGFCEAQSQTYLINEEHEMNGSPG